MPYYIRVLSTAAECIPLGTLQSRLKDSKLEAVLSADQGTQDDWEQLILQHSDGPEIASIERNPVEAGSLGAEELAEFADEIADAKPASAVPWLLEYFGRVKCIYAFQLLSGTDHKNGWDILDVVRNPISSYAPSILRADGEFSATRTDSTSCGSSVTRPTANGTWASCATGGGSILRWTWVTAIIVRRFSGVRCRADAERGKRATQIRLTRPLSPSPAPPAPQPAGGIYGLRIWSTMDS